MRMDVRIQHERRKTLALKATPKGVVALIPNELAADSPRVKRFIEAGLGKLETVKVSETLAVLPDELRDRVDMWAERLGVQVRRVQIRAMRTKWASCSTNGTLTLNADVLKLPPDLVDYVLCHDLLHLKLPDHGKGFRASIGCYLPDWRKRELALARWSARLD
jgi:predicted metal-dependent hydrolase